MIPWLLLGSILVARPGVTEERPSRPNVLVIVSDDQGWNDVGYHNPDLRTPTLDRLAATGVELDCHYVQPQCTPTRVALMTGRYPSRFGPHACQASNDQAFPVGTLTMATMFKALGYDTGMSGKWHLGSKPEWGPNQHGFDSSHGSLTGAVGMYDHRYRLGSPFETTWHRDHEWIEQEGHVTDLTADEAVGWIEDHTTDPWFFYVPFHAVHTPLVERDERWHGANAHIEEHDRRLFAAALSHMDDAIGRMVDALERTGQRDRTLILFTSDNGAQVHHGGDAYPPPDPKLRDFSSNAPLRGRKTQVFEGGYRVPALLSWPGILDRARVTAPIHAVDWLPTLSMLLGFEWNEDPVWDGVDVWPLVSGARTEPFDRPIYIVWGARRQREALREGDWKIVRNGGETWSLFHLADDPLETKDLAGDEPETLARLMETYRRERAKDAE